VIIIFNILIRIDKLSISQGAILWSGIKIIFHFSAEVIVVLHDSLWGFGPNSFPVLSILCLWVANKIGQRTSNHEIVDGKVITTDEFSIG